MVAVIGRIGSFGAVPALSVVTPLLVFPIIARHFGAEGVVAVSVGQSVGAVAGIAVALSWPMTGAAAVARADKLTRRSLYEDSLRSRYVILIAVIAPAATVAALLVSSHRLAAAGCAIAVSGYGLTASWYYSGAGDGAGLVRYEAIPRIAASATSGLLMLGGAPLVVYPTLLAASVILTDHLNSLRILGRLRARVGIRSSQLRGQFPVTAARLLNGLYSAGAVSLVVGVAPSASLVFAACDRLQKPLLNAYAALPQALLSSVVKRNGSSKARQRQALLVNVVFALLLGACFYMAFPLIVHGMYFGLVAPSQELAAVTAAGLAVGAIARALLTNGLLAAQDDRFAARSLLTVSGVGLAGIAAGAVHGGAIGALLAFTLAETALVLIAATRLVVLWARSD